MTMEKKYVLKNDWHLVLTIDKLARKEWSEHFLTWLNCKLWQDQMLSLYPSINKNKIRYNEVTEVYASF
jgi:hypothetical protein